jgi:hypothetical protein
MFHRSREMDRILTLLPDLCKFATFLVLLITRTKKAPPAPKDFYFSLLLRKMRVCCFTVQYAIAL